MFTPATHTHQQHLMHVRALTFAQALCPPKKSSKAETDDGDELGGAQSEYGWSMYRVGQNHIYRRFTIISEFK